VIKAFRWLLGDDTAQDLMEYALLGAFIGVVGLLAWQGIVAVLGQEYADYGTGVSQQWEPPAPASGS
jgi:hypothetical protein